MFLLWIFSFLQISFFCLLALGFVFYIRCFFLDVWYSLEVSAYLEEGPYEAEWKLCQWVIMVFPVHWICLDNFLRLPVTGFLLCWIDFPEKISGLFLEELSTKRECGFYHEVHKYTSFNSAVFNMHACWAESDSVALDCSPQGSSVHGILQARILEWIAKPSSRGSSRLRDRTQVS